MTPDFKAEEIIKLALEKAQEVDYEVPIGAIITHPQKGIIAKAANLVETKKSSLLHAETIVIQQALEKTGEKWLNGYSIYITLEPCHYCAAAISLARIENLYFGAFDKKTGGVVNGAKVLEHMHHKPKVQGGILAKECGKVVSKFFKKLRKTHIN